MKKSLLIIGMLIAAVFLTPLTMAIACDGTDCVPISDPQNGEENLYKIFHTIFPEAETYSSSNALFAARGFNDNSDAWWESIGDSRVEITVRYAGYSQELGIILPNGSYQAVVPNISGGYQNISVPINTPSSSFAFADKINGGNAIWCSDVNFSTPNDGWDHFRAFQVTDLYNAKYPNDTVERAWLIAFEDIAASAGGDCDFNDLVALVVEVRPETTLITLTSFTAKASNGSAKLEWVTESEIDNAGFNLYRAESESGAFSKINAALIPAKGSSTQGTSYEFTDTNVQNRKTYYYKLEDIDHNGNSTMHGPVSATPRWIYGMGK